MSVRAYKVKSLELEKEPLFNLWHDEELMNIISIYGRGLEEGEGFWEFSTDNLEQALKEAKEQNATKETIYIIKRMIKDSYKDGFVLYECY